LIFGRKQQKSSVPSAEPGIKRMAPKMGSPFSVQQQPALGWVPPPPRWTKEGSPYTFIPEIVDKDIEQIELKPVTPPFTYMRILFNTSTNEYIYELLEPQLTPKDTEMLELIKDTLTRTLEYDWEKINPEDKNNYLKESVESYLKTRGIPIDPISKEKIIYYIIRDFVGFGPIDLLLNDPMVEDISCDGPGIPIFIFHQKYESIKTNISFEKEEELNSYVIGLGQRCGKQISVSSPILDGTTPEGHRVQATYSREVTTRGSSFTIRRFKETPFTPVDLIKYNTASPEILAYVWLAVEHGDSMIVCGGTASGKTSTLNAATIFIPPAAKIISMEDTREINLPHQNWIPGATRSGFGERGPDGKAQGEIDMFDLVRAALRQRPNYIIVGEVRGRETYTLFQAMATGHTTYSTMHADSIKSMVNRLENPPISCPRILLTALNFVIIQSHVRVGMNTVRRIKQLIEIIGFEPETNELITNTVYEWDPGTDSFIYKGHSFLQDKIMEMKNLTHDEYMEEFQRRVEIINYFVKNNITDFREISRIIVSYYREPEETIAQIRKEMGWGST
jgi:flagellar protein FlaI